MFKKKTVDSVMAVFTKTIEDLEVVGVAQRDAGERKMTEAARLQNEAEQHFQENDRAYAIRCKLVNIMEA